MGPIKMVSVFLLFCTSEALPQTAKAWVFG